MPVPVLTIAEMRAWEQASWVAGAKELDVIRCVGAAVGRTACRLTQSGDRILILAGRGNNGADARAAEPHLNERTVERLDIMDPAAAVPALSAALARRPALVVDGLFGIGVNRPLSREWCRLMNWLNEAQLRVLAVDVPSGLDGDTGESWGGAVQATETLTVGAPKAGLLASAAVDLVGRLEVVRDVGLVGEPPSGGSLLWALAEDFLGRLRRRLPTTHKGSLGHTVVLAGSVGYTGAAVLAARAAGRARPGLVSVLTSPDAWQTVASQLVTAMVHPFSMAHPILDRASAILVGPGLAAMNLPPGIHSEVLRLWREFPGVMVADASVLDWLSPGTVPGGPRIVTPHPGEAGRMLGRETVEVQKNRVAALRQLAELFQTLVVLKGHQTLIGASTGPVFVNPVGNPGLAQGGTGDVLAGFLAGLVAQPAMREDLLWAARFATWQHGAGADRLEAVGNGWTAEDLVSELHA
ncbi:MAG TPA: NAD(P)H-hydrate dehydratase [Verrucomicrobiota bacterium]|nr:NAD(P)H-hydrate dehydratase [Verrucomicrobiota bacterium]